jgi:hypothetical protein
MGRALSAGACLGLLILVRNANLAVLPFAITMLAARRALSLKGVLTLGGAALLVVTVQWAATCALWGKLGYYLYPDESFALDWRGVLFGLFSARHGLLVHHPWYALLILLNVISLFKAPAHRWLAAGALAGWLALAIGNGLWWCWWFGDSFGNRGFIEALVPLSFGAAAGCSEWRLSRRARTALVIILALCMAANAYLWAGYLLQRYAHDGHDALRHVYGWILFTR